jgi:hypothetical protein
MTGYATVASGSASGITTGANMAQFVPLVEKSFQGL